LQIPSNYDGSDQMHGMYNILGPILGTTQLVSIQSNVTNDME